MNRLMPWLIAGLVLRLVLSAFVYHPDIRGYNLGAYLISQKHQLFTFYDFLSQLPPPHQLVRLYHAALFIYPPLAFLVPAAFMSVLSPLYPWQLFQQFIFGLHTISSIWDTAGLFLLLKLPLLVADLLALYVLRKLLPDKARFAGSLLWLFNPITLYATYMISQFDIYLALLTLIALYCASKNNYLASSIYLGLAAGFKPFPLFFLPFLPGKKVVNLAVGLVTYLLVILPYIPSPAFRAYALFAPQTSKLQYAKIPISETQFLPLFVVGIGLLLWFQHTRRFNLSLPAWLTAVPLLFYSLSHFHPQWLVWVSPQLVILFATLPRLRLQIIAFLGLYFALVLFF